jgi:spermidine/putrescine transport system substrate-binding protein
MLGEGTPTEKATLDDVMGSIDTVREQLDAGQLRRFTGNDYTTELSKGNVWASMAYSGDILQLQKDEPNLEFVVPRAGALLPTDNMLMPAKVEHPYAAETFMNFVYEPEIAAILAGLGYVSPVGEAAEVLRRSRPELAENELIFPSAELRSRLHPHPELSPEEEQEATVAFQDVIGA